jgi:hypothetical protein
LHLGASNAQDHMSRAILCFAAVLAVLPALAAGFDHAVWDRVLKAHVNETGEVDYAALKARREDLDEYIRLLGESSPVNRPALFPSRAHELAYWINAYNAFVMRGVVDGYPTRSVRDLGVLYGFFRRKEHTAGGVKMSLLHLEDDILRKKYQDPRIHFAIVCASISCPFLNRDAYTGEKLEEQLERAARDFINQRRSLTINAPANQVTLGAVFGLRDYAKDFEATGVSLLDYVRRYANPENRRALDALKSPRIKFYDYDWSINDPGSRARNKNPLERELARGGK